MRTTCATWGSVHMPAADWINMKLIAKRITQAFLVFTGFMLIWGAYGGMESAEDIIDWYWLVVVFAGGVCAGLVAIRIDACTGRLYN